MILLLSFVCAALSYFLDFALGFPMSDKPNTHAILFKWTLFLAQRRMKTADKEAYEIIKEYPLDVVLQARRFMTWEYAMGYCAICTNVWTTLYLYMIALIFAPLPYYDYIGGATVLILFKIISTVLLSHVILRKYLFN